MMNLKEYCERYVTRNQRPIERELSTASLDEAMRVVEEVGTFMTPAFRIDKDNEKTYRLMMEWCLGISSTCNPTKGIYLWGDTGTGKTMLLSLMNHVCRIFNIRIKTAEGTKPIMWKTARADEICDQYAEDGDIKAWVEPVSLCINDLGAEPSETLYMGNHRKVLRSIIEQRADRADRLTMITSNYPADATELANMYGERVKSRFHQICNIVQLPGKDRRLN